MSDFGLSFSSKLAERPKLASLLEDGVDGPKNLVTPVFYDGKVGDSTVVESFLVDLICRACLPDQFKGVSVRGACAGVVLLNADHHVKIPTIAEELQRRVNHVAEQHYRSLPRDRRSKERLTSLDQWQIVKRSMERVLILEVYTPTVMEANIVKLRKILDGNQSISLVLISSINTFFHQASSATGIYHNAYLRRLLSHLVEATKEIHNNVRALYVQHNFFKRADNFYDFRNPKDILYDIKDSVKLSVVKAPGAYVMSYDNHEVSKSIL